MKAEWCGRVMITMWVQRP